MLTRIFMAIVSTTLLGAGAAWGQPCVECWTSQCPNMATYLPKCGAARGRPKPPDKVEPRSHGCPEGQEITVDTRGHCCWKGQAWADDRCVGVPTSCPRGMQADVNKQACTVPDCEAGKTRASDGVHCCFPGQAWHSGRSTCVGVPTTCPPGLVSRGERCVDPNAPDGAGASSPAADCPAANQAEMAHQQAAQFAQVAMQHQQQAAQNAQLAQQQHQVAVFHSQEAAQAMSMNDAEKARRALGEAQVASRLAQEYASQAAHSGSSASEAGDAAVQAAAGAAKLRRGAHGACGQAVAQHAQEADRSSQEARQHAFEAEAHSQQAQQHAHEAQIAAQQATQHAH
jgi:hypothetical protein